MTDTRPGASRPPAASAPARRRSADGRSSRAGVVVLAAVAPAAALLVDPAGWYPFGPVKWLAVSVLVPLGAAMLLAGRPLRLHRRATAAGAALVAWMAVAAAFGEDPLYAWTGTPERHFGVLTWGLLVVAFVAGQSTELDTDGPVLAWGLSLAGLGVGAVATVEALGWEPAPLDVAGRLTGTFGSAAYLGAATALLLPVVVGVALDRGLSSRLRGVAGAAVLPLTVACLGAGARAAWFGLLVAALVAAWSRRSWFLARRRRSLAGLAGGSVLLIAVLLVTPVGARTADLFDPDSPGGQGRLDEWRVAARVVAAHPLTGVGPEGYRIAFGGAADRRYEQEHGRDQLPDRAHAGPLDVAVAGGLPALVLWGAVVVAVGRAVVRALRGQRALSAGLALGLVAHVAGQLLLFPVVELEPVAWLLAGVLLAAAPPGENRSFLAPRALPVGLVVVATLAAVAGTLDVLADREAARVVEAREVGDAAGAVRGAARATGLRPDTVRLHLLEARARAENDEGTLAALAAVDRALAVSPGDPIARRERAALLVERAGATLVPAHATAAVDAIEPMLADDPWNARLRRLAAAAADLAGDPAAAERHWAVAEDLDPHPTGRRN